MDKLLIEGGYPLEGEVRVSGAKNAALPILCAALLCREPLTLTNVPRLNDVRTMQSLLAQMGVKVDRPQADRAAAGQRHARFAAAREQRPQRQDRRAHRLHQLVRRERPVDASPRRASRAPRRASTRDAHLREQRRIVRTSFSRGTLVSVSGSRREQRRAQDRQRRVLGAGNAHFALRADAALDHQLVHRATPGRRRRRCAPTAPASASASTAHGSPRASGRRARRRRAGAARAAQARETPADDQRLEMLAVAVDLDVLAGDAGCDRRLDGFGRDHADPCERVQ